MNAKLLGIILLVGGAVLLYFGWEEKESTASEISEAVTNNPTDDAKWMLGGGAVAVAAGIFLATRKGSSG